MRLMLFALIMVYSLLSFAQSKQDYQWFFGDDRLVDVEGMEFLTIVDSEIS